MEQHEQGEAGMRASAGSNTSSPLQVIEGSQRHGLAAARTYTELELEEFTDVPGLKGLLVKTT